MGRPGREEVALVYPPYYFSSFVFEIEGAEISPDLLKNVIVASGATEATTDGRAVEPSDVEFHAAQLLRRWNRDPELDFQKAYADVLGTAAVRYSGNVAWSHFRDFFHYPTYTRQDRGLSEGRGLTWTFDIFNPRNGDCFLPVFKPENMYLEFCWSPDSLPGVFGFSPEDHRRRHEWTAALVEFIHPMFDASGAAYGFEGGFPLSWMMTVWNRKPKSLEKKTLDRFFWPVIMYSSSFRGRRPKLDNLDVLKKWPYDSEHLGFYVEEYEDGCTCLYADQTEEYDRLYARTVGLVSMYGLLPQSCR